MAQINLLKQNTPSYNFQGSLPKVITRILVLVLLVLVAYYVWLIFEVQNTQHKILAVGAKLVADQQSALNLKDRNELLTRQQQIQELSSLIGNHFYWSQLFPALAQVTLKAANYSSLRVTSDGELNLNVTVPALTDLDKFMQVFNLSQFNKDFSNIRIDGFSQVQSPSGPEISFQVKMQYDPSVIQYNANSNYGN